MKGKWLFLVVWVLGGCSEGPSAPSAPTSSLDTVLSKQWQHIQAYLQAVPSPLQIGQWMKQARIPYNSQILHNPEKADLYITTSITRSAANLGIYFVDMAYSYHFRNYERTLRYMRAVQKLAGEFGIGDLFVEERLRKLEAFEDQPDSLLQQLNAFYAEVYQRLEAQRQVEVLRHMLVGAWIEAIHIFVNTLAPEAPNPKTLEVIAAQKEIIPLVKQIFVIDTHQTTSHLIYQYLEAMEKSYMQTSTTEQVVLTRKGKVYQINMGKADLLSTQTLEKLQRTSAELRNYLIQL
ncbi:MAG: hypothetical protein ACUVRD_05155 [Bacteroidia bacterium]